MTILQILTKLFGAKQDRDLKKLTPLLARVKAEQAAIHELSDEQLALKTSEFRERLKNGETLDDLLPEAYSVFREATHRILGERRTIVDQFTQQEIPFMAHFDVQILGAIILHQGKIAEMKTGEGKTQAAAMATYLNALSGLGVHVITVNDYLARRDSEWMGKIFKFLGLTVGCLDLTEPHSQERRDAYRCDITFGTNNEYGFDYLRDNMATSPEQCVQRELNFAIIDEVDNILIDEARTPLIISGQVNRSNKEYEELKPRVVKLINAQNQLVQKIIAEAEQLLDQEGKEYECGLKMLIVQKGAPKNKRLAEMLKLQGVARYMKQVETDYLRDRKLHLISEELYFTIDESGHSAELSEKGRLLISGSTPEFFIVPDLAELIGAIDKDASIEEEEKILKREEAHRFYAERTERIHSISQLVRAYSVYEIDVDYVVQEGQILIVDEFTGRILHGRRYSDGLHQALEAKEGVKVAGENQTLSTITFQNFFKMYRKVGGMTGTAVTEAGEFHEIYKLDVVSVPTNRPLQRKDHNDEIYKTYKEKYNAIVQEIENMHKIGRPCLVGTTSIEKSELLGSLLMRAGIPHEVLNAKQHAKEASIVAQAGRKGAVTIATNMAGRGTDIVLGGNFEIMANHELIKDGIDPAEITLEEKRVKFSKLLEKTKEEQREVLAAGGLHIIGTERHESRRIDNQLRGRAGRQGDPGSSKFFLSLDDDLMRIFGSERIVAIMDRLGAEEGEVISHPLVSRSIGGAQKRVEGRNFEIRKHLKDYDDVMNMQRKEIYGLRQRILRGEDLKEEIINQIEATVEEIILNNTVEGKYPEDWPLQQLYAELQTVLGVTYRIPDDELSNKTQTQLFKDVAEVTRARYNDKERRFGSETMRQFERSVFLMVIDNLWKDHLYEMDHLKSGVQYRSFGQKNPLYEYQREGLKMFEELRSAISKEVTNYVFRLERVEENTSSSVQKSQTVHGDIDIFGSSESKRQPVSPGVRNAPPVNRSDLVPHTIVKSGVEVGRNEPCPCGSGKKYKKCHGAV